MTFEIGDRIRGFAAADPARGAVECGSRTMTYQQLAERIDERCAQLRARTGPGELVVIDRPRSPGFVVDFLAVLALGAVAVPIDPDLPQRRRHALRRALLPVAVPADAAYVFFTSGSTGTPKPVLGSAAALWHFLAWQVGEFGVGAGDRVAFLTTVSFDVMVRELMLPLWAGGTLVIPGPDEAGSPEATAGWLAERRISVVDVVPSVARRWLRPGTAAVPSVRLVFFAGEPLTGALAEQWQATFPGTRARVNFYGTTETTLPKVFKRIPRIVPTAGVLPAGQPVPGASCTLTAAGEVVLTSRWSSHGYLGLPEATAERFAWLDGGEVAYRTGDLGHFDESGDLVVAGRIDDEVKVNGVRIHPAEVAAALRACDGVRDAYVLGGPLTAYVVAADVPAVRRELLTLLPPAMMPSRVVDVPELPLLPNGKVDRTALRRLDVAPPPGPVTPPSGPMERWVAARWAELLGTTDISATDDFLGYGGDSITAMRLAARIRRDFGIALSVRSIFASSTVAALAHEIAVRTQEQSA